MLSLARAVRRICVTACLSGITLSGASALAADSQEIAAAREAFDKGLALEAAGSWEAALVEYRRVAKVRATSAVRFHIARCLDQIGQWTEAIGAYELAANDAQGPDREEIVRLSTAAIARLRQTLPSLRITSDGNSQAVRLRLDGVDIRAESYRAFRVLDPGRHELEVRAGEHTQLHVISLAPREQKTFELVVPPPTGSKGSLDSVPPTVADGRAQANRGVGPWLLISGGAASGIGAVLFWELARGKETDLRHACYTVDVCPTSAKAIHDQGEHYTLAANIAGGVGIAAMGAGLAWWLWPTSSRSPRETGRLRLTISPTNVSLSGAF